MVFYVSGRAVHAPIGFVRAGIIFHVAVMTHRIIILPCLWIDLPGAVSHPTVFILHHEHRRTDLIQKFNIFLVGGTVFTAVGVNIAGSRDRQPRVGPGVSIPKFPRGVQNSRRPGKIKEIMSRVIKRLKSFSLVIRVGISS